MNLLRLKTVLAAIDYDDASVAALKGAHALAGAAGAKLHIVHVDAPGAATETLRSTPSIDSTSEMFERAGLRMDRVQSHTAVGDAAHAIRSLSDRIRADVIVLGPHRQREADGRPLGSTALSVVTSSWAPCLVVARDIRLPLERVLVPVDLSDTSRGALTVALSWACALRRAGRGSPSATLTAIFVDRAPGSESASRRTASLEEELDRMRRKAGTWAGVAIDGEVISSADVPAGIARYAKAHQPDLVVLGTRGLGLDDVGRLGSVSAAVAREVQTPVLLVPPAVWIDYTRQS